MSYGDRHSPTPFKCGAPTRSPDKHPCTRPAGFRTDHLGYGHCKFHGGTSPNGIKYAARLQVEHELQLAKKEAAKNNMLPTPDNPEDPKAAIRWLIALGVQRVAQLESVLTNWDSLDPGVRASAMNRSLQERNHLGTISTTAHKLSIDEEHERNQIASLFLFVFQQAILTSELGLSRAQERRFMKECASLLTQFERSPTVLIGQASEDRPGLTEPLAG